MHRDLVIDTELARGRKEEEALQKFFEVVCQQEDVGCFFYHLAVRNLLGPGASDIGPGRQLKVGIFHIVYSKFL